MKNSSLPKQAQDVSGGFGEDIPEAVRDTPISSPAPRSSPKPGLFWRMLGLAVLAFACTLWINYQFGILSPKSATIPTPQPSVAFTPPIVSPSPSPSPVATSSPSPVSEDLLGHLPYEEAPAAELESLTADGSQKLRKAAAKAYLDMEQAARADGVILVPLSTFRSLKEQESVFFDIKQQRGQVATQRATVSAPPGYSEHHTGYAIDIGDGEKPSTDLSTRFEETQAFQWLKKNAAYYSFELSFPKNNPQGVSYEPWHWRFVGDRHSLETFYKARQKKNN